MNRQQQIEAMAYLVCEMANKPDSCKDCPGRKGGCFTIPKMEKLVDNALKCLEPFEVREIVEKQQEEILRLQTENERLSNEVKSVTECKFESVSQAAKSEAYEEFAEGLFVIMRDRYLYEDKRSSAFVTQFDIDNLLKQMKSKIAGGKSDANSSI